jgi:hypothetical protein
MTTMMTLQLRWLRVKRHWRSVQPSPRAARDAVRVLAADALTRDRLCRRPVELRLAA